MFNFTTICESVKRHWIAIVLITAARSCRRRRFVVCQIWQG